MKWDYIDEGRFGESARANMESVAVLAERARAGDREIFGELVRRCQQMAWRYACSILRDQDRADDAVQEAFLEAYLSLFSLREPAAFESWLRRLVFKHCDRLIRRRAVPLAPLQNAEDLPSAAPDPRHCAQRREIAETVMAAVAALPGGERRVTELYYLEDLTQSEVAEQLGLPVSTVNTRLHSARSRLRARMPRDFVEQEISRKVLENMNRAKSPGHRESSKRKDKED